MRESMLDAAPLLGIGGTLFVIIFCMMNVHRSSRLMMIIAGTAAVWIGVYILPLLLTNTKGP